jgi:F5/8 type C domain
MRRRVPNDASISLRVLRLVLLATLASAAPVRAAPDPIVLDDFEQLDRWSVTASEGSSAWILPDTGHTGMGMHIGFDLHPANGFLIVRKAFSIPLPENYAFTFQMRGEALPNDFEFKIVGSRQDNVWWRRLRGFQFKDEWQQMTIRKSRLEHAWGTASGSGPEHTAAIELAIKAGQGGRGSVWIDELYFEERDPVAPSASPPRAEASSFVPGLEPERVLDQDPTTVWKSQPSEGEEWLQLDLGQNRDYGGLAIDWDPEDYAKEYEVRVSNDGTEWSTSRTSMSSNGGRDYVYMPEGESRFIRLQLLSSSRGKGYGIESLTLEPLSFSSSPNRFFETIAGESARGFFPKWLYGVQSYWTVVGVDADDKEGLLNEEGMLEVDQGAFSVEPFLYTDGHLVTWNDVRTRRELAEGDLPIPTVTWETDGLTLAVTALATGRPQASTLLSRYRITNRGGKTIGGRLFLAVRPFQVLPPWQTLNITGGVSRIDHVVLDGGVVRVNESRPLLPLTPPSAFGATAFDDGPITEFLAAGKVPPEQSVFDPLGFASAALQYDFELAPGKTRDVVVAAPLHDPYLTNAALLEGRGEESFFDERLDEVTRYWREATSRVQIGLPPSAEKIARSVNSTLAYILINRDGPAIQPGSRNYARSWIRDGAVTAAALLEMGHTEEVRDYLRWFAGYQFADGKIPCCVDWRGSDPVSEHDSHGEFIYTVMEYYRFTRDVGFLYEMWPHVVRAVEYMAKLRAARLTEEYRTPEAIAFYGLLPESISHEGYSSQAVHSYWDDFFALRGFKDAVDLAVVMGDDERASRFAELRDAFRRDLYTSIGLSMTRHRIDFIPGSAELGDFDPTSTAIALAPGGELANLPEPALRRTFDKYYEDFRRRVEGRANGEAYTAYELRTVGALVRLGERDRALEILRFMVADQRPPEWNQWPEISWLDPTVPKFVGDMPHTWIGSGFIRSVRDMLAYEREGDRSLVLAAGVPPEWVREKPGVSVKRLPTHYGILSYTMRADDSGALHVRLSGDLSVPPGGIVIVSPMAEPILSATVNGAPVVGDGAEGVTVREFPAEVVMKFGSGGVEEEGQAAGAANEDGDGANLAVGVGGQ